VEPASIEPARPVGSERDVALKRLQDAFADGQLSYEEFDERLHRVMTASTADAVAIALDALPVPDEGRVVSIVAMNGRIRRSGSWTVPRILRIESDYGSLRLDFSQAAFEARVVDVEVQLRFGGAKIVVPADAVVDLDGLQSVWKQPRYTRPRRLSGTGPVVRITGTMEYGRLKVRHRRR
jgi:hypothetical protein